MTAGYGKMSLTDTPGKFPVIFTQVVAPDGSSNIPASLVAAYRIDPVCGSKASEFTCAVNIPTLKPAQVTPPSVLLYTPLPSVPAKTVPTFLGSYAKYFT